MRDIRMPCRTKYVEPQNPVQATATDFPSVVVLHCQLDVKGQVVSCDSKRARSETFSDTAIDVVKQWRYTPFTLRGAPTSLWFTVVVNFTQKKNSRMSSLYFVEGRRLTLGATDVALPSRPAYH